MRVDHALLLLGAALLPTGASAEGPWNVLDQRIPRHFPRVNNSSSISAITPSSKRSTSSKPAVNTSSTFRSGRPVETRDASRKADTGSHGLDDATYSIAPHKTQRPAQPGTNHPHTPSTATSSHRSSTPHTFHNGTQSTDRSHRTTSRQSKTKSSTSDHWTTVVASDKPRTTSRTAEPQVVTNDTVGSTRDHCDHYCTPQPKNRPVTEYAIVYTSTVTFYGNSTQYTPPFRPVVTPNYCPPGSSPTSSCPPYGGAHPSSTPGTGTYRTKTPSPIFITSESIINTPHESPQYSMPPKEIPQDTMQTSISTRTVVITSKNPAVVYKPRPTPDYKPPYGHPGGLGPGNGNHKTVINGGGQGPDEVQRAPPTFQITAGRNQVIINGKTFDGLNPTLTTTVTADNGVFTILPTAVEGEGVTVSKPTPSGPDVSIREPTGLELGGASISAFGSVVVIDGTTMTMGSPTKTMVNGRTVSLGPGTILVNGQALTFNPVASARQTDEVIVGGEILEADGQSVVVVHETTFTYGPQIPVTTEVVDDDTITIGPTGVVVHGTTFGGPSVDDAFTDFEVVGGATISKIIPSEVVINGATFTVGPGAHLKTTVIGGETITIGPAGVIVSTMTIPYPFGPSVTTTITPSGTFLNDFPLETGSSDDDDDGDEEDSGSVARPDMRIGAISFCIAIGVWVLF